MSNLSIERTKIAPRGGSHSTSYCSYAEVSLTPAKLRVKCELSLRGVIYSLNLTYHSYSHTFLTCILVRVRHWFDELILALVQLFRAQY